MTGLYTSALSKEIGKWSLSAKVSGDSATASVLLSRLKSDVDRRGAQLDWVRAQGSGLAVVSNCPAHRSVIQYSFC
jgi:hypothetical protein